MVSTIFAGGHHRQVRSALRKDGIASRLPSIDRLRLLDRLDEDGAFGCHVFEALGRTCSRDLIDSVIELNFLEQVLGLSSRPDLHVLDIGAGYGRLAHRTTAAFPRARYTCVDAVPTSTFLSERYVEFRGIGDRVSVIALDEFEATLEPGSVDLAINVHSFPECRLEAIEWWVARLRGLGVPYVLIVPNTSEDAFPRLMTIDGKDFAPVLARYGYTLRVHRAKYDDAALHPYALNPAQLYLFGLDD
jgi:SAM-dependent methyltransferase